MRAGRLHARKRHDAAFGAPAYRARKVGEGGRARSARCDGAQSCAGASSFCISIIATKMKYAEIKNSENSAENANVW